MAVETKIETKKPPARPTPMGLQGPVKEAFLITNCGIDELIGNDALKLEEKINKDVNHTPFDYRRFDHNKHVWAYWAVENSEGIISPFALPDSKQYSTTSPQLYTKAVVFPQVVTRIARKLKEVPPSMWDKMMKPATILLTIFGILIVIAIFMVAAAG